MSNLNEAPAMPLLQHAFHCSIEGNFSEEEVQIWSKHVQSCDYDFKNNIVTVVLYQSIHPALYRIVEKVAHDDVEELVVSPTMSECIIVSGINCIDHNMMFNYSGDEKVIHVIRFSYRQLWHEHREFDIVDETTDIKERIAQAVSPKEAVKKLSKKKK